VTHWLSLARAAQLVGVHRSTLQRMVRDGGLASVEGRLSTEELLRAFPGAVPEDTAGLERVTRIKEESFGRRVRERLLPSQEILAQRLFAQSQELADTRRHLQRYHALLDAVLARLGDLAATHAPSAALAAWADAELARVLAMAGADRLEVLDTALGVMSPRVTVRPSGREFLAEGRDTLLQAGLKAGLGFAYGCGNGTCGLCKARVLGGEVRRVLPHDYPLSEAERAQGHVLMCCYAPVTDVQVETLEASGPADIPLQTMVTAVRAVTPLASDTMMLHLQTPRSSRLRFLAGQMASLGAADARGDVHGTYPIASCPCDDRNIQFHIGRDDTDAFAEALFAGRLRPNDAVTLAGPKGRFVLDAASGRPLVFAACDLGFAPVKSLVEYALSAEAAASCAILWLATRPDGHYLSNQCRAWADSLDGFRFVALADGDPAAGAARLLDAWPGRTAAADCDVYVAGGEAFNAACASAFRQAGVPEDRLFTEVI
jgi:CDP-4-dehydro-6-deoxyglucose reductase